MQPDMPFFQLGDWLIDCEQQRIQKDSIWIDVPSLSFKLLLALVENAGVVVSNDQLINTVWGEKQVVSDENLQQRIRILRKILGDTQNASYIGTVRGKGYRLLILPEIPDKKQTSAEIIQGNTQAQSDKKIIVLIGCVLFIFFIVSWCGYQLLVDKKTIELKPLQTKHRIAVLPFSQSQPLVGFEDLNQGLTEQVISGISNFTDTQVISYKSVQGYSKKLTSIDTIAEQLQVDTVLTGQLRHQNEKIYFKFNVIDAIDGQYLLSDELIIQRSNIASLSNRILSRLSSFYSNKMVNTRSAQGAYQQAYRFYLTGRKHYLRYNRLDNDIAINFFRKSLANSPVFTLALCGLSDALSQQVYQYGADKQIANEALRLAEAAVNLDPDLAEAYKAKGFALDIAGRYPEAILAYQAAISLDPNYADAILNKAVLHWEANDYSQAYTLINQVIALDPLEVFGYLLKAEILAGAGDFERAAPIFEKLSHHHPDNIMVAQGLAQFYFDNGEYEKAAIRAKELMQLAPSIKSVQVLLADSLLFSGQWQQAKSHYEKLALLEPSWEVIYARLRLKIMHGEQSAVHMQAQFDKEINDNGKEANVNLLLLSQYLNTNAKYSTLNIFEQLIEKDRISINWVINDPHLKRLRDNEQYAYLKNKLKKLKQQRQALLQSIDKAQSL